MKRRTLIILMITSISSIITTLGFCFQRAPKITLSLFLIGVCVFIFLLTERWYTHHAAEFENRFWSLIAFFSTFTCLFCSDSPFRLVPIQNSLTSSSITSSTSPSSNINEYINNNEQIYSSSSNSNTPFPSPSSSILSETIPQVSYTEFTNLHQEEISNTLNVIVDENGAVHHHHHHHYHTDNLQNIPIASTEALASTPTGSTTTSTTSDGSNLHHHHYHHHHHHTNLPSSTSGSSTSTTSPSTSNIQNIPWYSIYHPWVSWFIILLITFLVHNYDRHLHRNVLTKIPNIKRVTSLELCEDYRISANEKAKIVSKNLESIDHRWMSSTFLNIFFLPYVLIAEHNIITILNDASSEELNYIISKIALPLILYKIKDHKVTQHFNRSRLLYLLSKERINDLTINSKAYLIDALQRLKLTAHHLGESYALNIITSMKQCEDLSKLKCYSDLKGDFNSMHKLIYFDIKDKAIQEEILEYIAKQANVHRAHILMKSKKAKTLLAQYNWKKIVSDVDDTLTCSGNSWPKGCDNKYPKDVLYPGVLAFYRELDLGSRSDRLEWNYDKFDGNLVFLSARPHVYKDVSESITYSKFQKLMKLRGMHTSPTLLSGSIDTGSQFVWQGSSEPLARQKLKNIREYMTIYPEFSFIFVGDNGQGDARMVELVHDTESKDNQVDEIKSPGKFMKPKEQSKLLERSYIHIVKPLDETYVLNPNTKTLKNNANIFYFNTYIEAAIDAYHHKLILPQGLKRIMEESIVDFELIKPEAWAKSYANSLSNPPPRSIPINSTPRSSRPLSSSSSTSSVLLNNSIENNSQSNSTSNLPTSSSSPSVTMDEITSPLEMPSPASSLPPSPSTSIPSTPTSERGLMSKLKIKDITSSSSSTSTTPVHTSSFVSRFIRSRYTPVNINAIKVITEKKQMSVTRFLRSKPKTSSSSSSSTTPGKSAADSDSETESKPVNNKEEEQLKNLKYYYLGMIKREQRQREINASIVEGNKIIIKHSLPPIPLLPYPQIYPFKTKVITAFGPGYIENYRSFDGIYELIIEKETILNSKSTGTATINSSVTGIATTSSSSSSATSLGVISNDNQAEGDSLLKNSLDNMINSMNNDSNNDLDQDQLSSKTVENTTSATVSTTTAPVVVPPVPEVKKTYIKMYVTSEYFY